MRAFRAWVCSGVAAVVCGCGGAGQAGGADGPRVFTAADVRVLGTSESLASVADLDVLPDGRVWALNALEPHFVGFGPDGVSLGEHGTLGGGPDEFDRPVGLVTGGMAGEAWALDVGRHAFVRISRPDESRVEVPLPADSVPPMSLVGGREIQFTKVQTARLGEAIVVPRSNLAGATGWLDMWAEIWGADLVAVDPTVGSAHGVVDLVDAFGDPRVSAPPTPAFLPFPPWFRLWAVCPSGVVRVHDRLSNRIRGFDRDGAEVAPVALPEPTLRDVSREEFALAMLEAGAMEAAGSLGLMPLQIDTATLLPSVRSRIEGDGAELAAVLPRYVDLHCDDDGALWARPFDIEVGGMRGGPRWLRIERDGARREVVMPARFDPLRFTAGRIWGVQRDELDVPSIAWIEW